MSIYTTIEQLATASDVTPELRGALISCWVDVTNAGGAAGFPYPPIDASQAGEVFDSIAESLRPETSRLLVIATDGEPTGWLNLRRDPFALIAHWGTIHHLQTHPRNRGRGLGTRLLAEARRIAKHEMQLEQLHLAARAGVGLEDFYRSQGWREIGRWPRALRLAEGDDRDEVLMVLDPL